MARRYQLLCLGVGGLLIITCAAVGKYFYKHRQPASPPEVAVQAPPTMLLNDEQREYLWQIEHHGLLLAKQGFSRLSGALAGPDRRALASLLANDFVGQSPAHYREVRAHTSFADVVRQQDSDQGRQVLSASQFLDQLLAFRAPFSKPPKGAFALMSFHPVEDGNLHGLWEGTGQFRLVGEVGDGQPAEAMLYLRYQVSEPLKPTLRAGGWIHRCEVEQAQMARTLRGPLLREVAAERGIDVKRLHDNWRHPDTPPTIVTGGVYLCDYNRDGWLDMLVTDVTGIALYQGLPGGKFKDVTTEVGLPAAWPTGTFQSVAAWIDINGDGWDDLIVGGRIWRNDGGKHFYDVTALSNFQIPPDATGIAIADFDRDGRLDFYVTRPGSGKADSWLSGKTGDHIKTNELWRNRGNWQFENVTAKTGTGGDHRSTFSAAWLDVNNDGWPDLYVINEFGNGVLYVNHQGKFEARQLFDGPADFGSMGLAAGDIDNDGNIDLYIGNMYSKAGNRVIGNLKSGIYPDNITAKIRTYVAGSQLWRNHGGLHFEPDGKRLQLNSVGWSYAPALVDLDNDGYLDIYATCGFISHSRTEPDG